MSGLRLNSDDNKPIVSVGNGPTRLATSATANQISKSGSSGFQGFVNDFNSFAPFAIAQKAGELIPGVAQTGVRGIEDLGSGLGHLASGAYSAITDDDKYNSVSDFTNSSAFAEMNSGIKQALGGASKVGTSAATLPFALGASAFSAAIQIVPGAEDMVGAAVEKFNEGVDAATSTSGIKFDDDAKQGVQDLVFALAGRFGLPVLGEVAKRASKSIKDIRNVADVTPEFMNSKIVDALDSKYKDTSNVEGMNEILAKFSTELNKKAESIDRPMTHYDVMQAAKNSGIEVKPKDITPSNELIKSSSIDDSINQVPKTNLDEVFTQKVADAISLNKKETSTLVASVAKETETPPLVVQKALDSFLLNNKRIADSVKDSTIAIKDSFDTFLKDEPTGPKFGNDVKNLVDNGMLKEVVTDETGMTKFEVTDSGKRFLGKDKANEIQSKTYSSDEWAKIKSQDGPTPYVKYSQEVIDKAKEAELNKALDKPDTIAKVLAKLQESGDDLSKIKSKDTKSATLNRVVNDIETYAKEGNRSGVVSSIISDLKYLGEKAMVDVSKAWEEKGGSTRLVPENLFDAISEIQKVKNEGWFNYSKLPIPKNLSSMLRRDSKVAERAFSAGEKTAKAVAETKISILRDKLASASLEEKAALRSQIAQIKESTLRSKDFTKSIFDTLDELKSKGVSGDYKFEGDQAIRRQVMNKITNDFKKRIVNVKTYSDYLKVTEKLAQTIEEANRVSLTKEISSFLKKYKNPETPNSVNPKQVSYEKRLVLEKVARTFDDYKNGLGVEQLSKLKEYLKAKEDMGHETYKRYEVLTKSMKDREVAKIKSENFKDLLTGSDDIDVNTGTKDPMKQAMASVKKNAKYSFDDFHRQLLKMFGDDITSTGYKRVGDIDLGRNRFNHVKEVVGQAYLKHMSKFKPTEVQDAEMGFLAKLQEDGFEKQFFFNKKGEYIGGDRPQSKNLPKFPKTEMEYTAWRNELKSKYEGTEMYENGYKIARKLFDDYMPKIQNVNVQFDNAAFVPIEKYWPTNNASSLKPGEEGFASIENTRKDIMDGFNKERTYEVSKGGLDFSMNTAFMNFIEKQVYYAEVRPAFERFRGLMKDVVADSNEYTKKLVDDYIKEVGNPSALPHNALNSLMSRVSANTLGGSATTVFKQFLALPDAIGFTGMDNLASGMGFVGLYPSVQSMKNHKLIKAASSFLAHSWGSDYTINKDLEVGLNSKLKKMDEFMLTPMKAADYWNKSAIWSALYLKEMKRQGFTGTLQDIADSGGFKNKDAVRIADDMTQRIAGSIDTTRLPPILRNPIGRAMMQLQSNAVNRYQLITNDVPRLFREDPKMGTIAAVGMLASSATEAYMSAISLYLRAKFGIKTDNDQSINEIAQGLQPGDEQDLTTIAEFITATIAKQNPVIGNLMSAAQYNSSGNATLDVLKNAIKTSNAAATAFGNDESEAGYAQLATLFTSLFGYSPGKNIVDSWKTAIKEQ